MPKNDSEVADKELVGLPTWLQLATQVIFKFGVPSAIAVYLVYIGASNLPAIRMELTTQHLEVQQIKLTLVEVQMQSERIQLMLQFICSNTSQTDTEKRACFQN